MAKKKPFQFVNMKKSLKKIENDISSIDNAIGGAHAEIINLAQVIIKREGFLEGKNSQIIGRKGGKIYKEVSGANRTRKNGDGGNVFHKSKLVDRGGGLPGLFEELNFSRGPLGIVI